MITRIEGDCTKQMSTTFCLSQNIDMVSHLVVSFKVALVHFSGTLLIYKNGIKWISLKLILK